MIRPTRRMILWAIYLFGGAVFFHALAPELIAIPLIFLIGLILVLITDILTTLPYRLLKLEFQCPKEIFIGMPSELQIKTAPISWNRNIKILIVITSSDLLDIPNPLEGTIISGEENMIPISLTPKRRGVAKVKNCLVYWYGPMRMVEFSKRFQLDQEVLVIPNISAVREAAIKFFTNQSFWGFKEQKWRGDGSEFTSLREYITGMDPRTIDWKHSAKHNKLISKEFQEERNHNVILVFDTGRLMSELFDDISRLDHSINSGLLLTYFALKKGDKIGVFTFDEEVRSFYKPVGGIYSYKRIQRQLSEINYHSAETNFTLGISELSRWLDRRSLIILFTDFVDTVSAQLMVQSVGYLLSKHLVIFASFKNNSLLKFVNQQPEKPEAMLETILTDELLQERKIVLSQLKQLGIHCLEVKSSILSTQLLNKYLEVKAKELI